MTEPDRTLTGAYFDGRRPLAAAATLLLAGGEATLFGEGASGRYPLSSLRVSPRTAGADRFIALPGGGQFQCADQPLLDELRASSPYESLVAWLEQRVAFAVAGIVISMLILAGAYFYGLPAAARAIAPRIPLETEQALGAEALRWLDQRRIFHPTQLHAAQIAQIQARFERLTAGLPLQAHYRLEFRDSQVIGPNAFALPGGTIVITDPLVRAAGGVDEVIAVLAHEIGHVELRHTMRHVLQDSAIAVLVAAVTADAASLSVAVAGLPVLLAQAKYSRGFESEADEFAFALLRRHGYSPEAFATFMERLSRGRKEAERTFSFASSHPITAERIQRAREAAR